MLALSTWTYLHWQLQSSGLLVTVSDEEPLASHDESGMCVGQNDEPSSAPTLVRRAVSLGWVAEVLEIYHAFVPASHIMYWSNDEAREARKGE